MAKITPGALVGEIRNALGGMVFSRNTYGAYIRNNVVPVNPATLAQTGVRNAFANIAQEWRALTDSQRADWNMTAEQSFPQTDVFGSSFQLTGFNLFMKLNLSLDAIGVSIITTAPLEQTIEQITTFAAVAEVDAMNDGSIVVNGGFPGPVSTVPTDRKLLIQASSVVSPGKEYNANLFKQIVTQSTGQDVSAVDITTQYENVYGALTDSDIGGKVFIRGVLVSTTNGQRGAMVTADDIFVSVP